jgi:hypothetical protein
VQVSGYKFFFKNICLSKDKFILPLFYKSYICWTYNSGLKVGFFFLFNFFGGGSGVWTQGFPFATQMLYLLRQASLFCYGYFGDRVLLFCPGQPGQRPSCFMPSLITGMTGVYHHTQIFFCWDGVLQNFLPELSWNLDPPDLRLPTNLVSRYDPGPFVSFSQ